MTIGILINVVFFLLMGVSALVRPRSVVVFVGLEPDTPDARNEVRAVYGGFGIAISVVLACAPYYPRITDGVLIAVAAALIGMALGRLVSFAIERPGRWPVIFALMESALAALLLYG
jgi:hypothetical protein